jgi:FtsH-binding integral membrane protein
MSGQVWDLLQVGQTDVSTMRRVIGLAIMTLLVAFVVVTTAPVSAVSLAAGAAISLVGIVVKNVYLERFGTPFASVDKSIKWVLTVLGLSVFYFVDERLAAAAGFGEHVLLWFYAGALSSVAVLGGLWLWFDIRGRTKSETLSNAT